MFDVVSTLIGWIPGKVGVPAMGTPHDPMPRELVTVERTGGAYSPGVDRPNLAVQCWSDSDAGAHSLALAVREAMALLLAEEVPEVCSCSIGSMYRFTDPDGRRARYQLDVYLTTRP